MIKLISPIHHRDRKEGLTGTKENKNVDQTCRPTFLDETTSMVETTDWQIMLVFEHESAAEKTKTTESSERSSELEQYFVAMKESK
jgi:hypothetical protein